MRHPMKWEDEEQLTGVFLGGSSAEAVELFQMPPAVRRVDRLTLPGTAAGLQDVAALLERVCQALAGFTAGAEPALFSVGHLDEAALALLDDALGEGEVGMIVASAAEYVRVQGIRMPGVWRVRAHSSRPASRSAIMSKSPKSPA